MKLMIQTQILAASILLLLGPVAAEEYRIGPDDVLQVSVYENDDLNVVVRVESDGRINVPLLGDVEVVGLSPPDVSKRLESLLADGYLVDPHVTVFVKEFKSRKVMVMGQVNRPGLYELSGSPTVIEVVSRAGGFTDLAAPSNVKIIRELDGHKTTKAGVEYSEAVMPNDVIVVPESLF